MDLALSLQPAASFQTPLLSSSSSSSSSVVQALPNTARREWTKTQLQNASQRLTMHAVPATVWVQCMILYCTSSMSLLYVPVLRIVMVLWFLLCAFMWLLRSQSAAWHITVLWKHFHWVSAAHVLSDWWKCFSEFCRLLCIFLSWALKATIHWLHWRKQTCNSAGVTESDHSLSLYSFLFIQFIHFFFLFLFWLVFGAFVCLYYIGQWGKRKAGRETGGNNIMDSNRRSLLWALQWPVQCIVRTWCH